MCFLPSDDVLKGALVTHAITLFPFGFFGCLGFFGFFDPF
jgi:hypothetical protein